MRSLFVVVHRWLGLAGALFLLIAGLTGAIISWDHELDEWLNPHLYKIATASGKSRSPLELAAIVEKADPRVRVSMFPLHYEVGHSAVMWVDAKADPVTSRRYEPGYNQVFVDPTSGAILGTREWGKAALDREHLLSFFYKLHFSLQLPEWGGIDRWGIWLMGIVALSWLVNIVAGFFLTLPARRRAVLREGPGRADDRGEHVRAVLGQPLFRSLWERWEPAWQVKRRAGTFRFAFDLHRAGGLWFAGLLLILAFTSFSLNLYREVFYPVMSLISTVTPGPFDVRKPMLPHQPVEPRVGWKELLENGHSEARRRGWNEPAGSVFYSDNFGIHGIRFFRAGDDHGRGGMGVKTLYFDGDSGRLLGDSVPWQGTAADIFVQLQFPLHSGRILGLPGRILISMTGVIVALLSITGVYIWWKKQRARVSAARREIASGRILQHNPDTL